MAAPPQCGIGHPACNQQLRRSRHLMAEPLAWTQDTRTPSAIQTNHPLDSPPDQTPPYQKATKWASSLPARFVPGQDATSSRSSVKASNSPRAPSGPTPVSACAGSRLRVRQDRGEQSQAGARIEAATRAVRMAPPVVDRNTVDADSLRWPPYATAIPRPRSASADSDAL